MNDEETINCLRMRAIEELKEGFVYSAFRTIQNIKYVKEANKIVLSRWQYDKSADRQCALAISELREGHIYSAERTVQRLKDYKARVQVIRDGSL